MVWTNAYLCAWLECSVVLFQLIGVGALCLHRLTPAARWAERGRISFVFAMVGLGVTGALCGGHDSEFALFAGGTMTFLLIGMTIGSCQAHATGAHGTVARAEANLAG